MALLGPYDRKARLIQGLLCIGPVAIAVATLGLNRFPAAAVVLGVGSAAGGGYLLAVFVANFGRRAQQELWKQWQARHRGSSRPGAPLWTR